MLCFDTYVMFRYNKPHNKQQQVSMEEPHYLPTMHYVSKFKKSYVIYYVVEDPSQTPRVDYDSWNATLRQLLEHNSQDN